MIKAMKALMNDRRGNVLVMVGFSMPLLVGFAGLATDTVQWSLWKRQLQRAADSAAIAAVYAKQDSMSAESAVTRDLAHTQNTGFTLLGAPQITHPTVSGYNYTTRVQLQLQRELSFSSFFMTSAPVITAAATAAATPGGDYCVISLEPNATQGIYATGNSNLQLGCGMITNATDLNGAAFATGSAVVNASPIAAVGGINTTSTNWASGTEFQPYTSPMEDPFAGVQANPPSTCNGGAMTVNSNQTRVQSYDSSNPANNCFTSIRVRGTLTLAPGTYYVSGGDFDLGSQAEVYANNGVTIVMTNVSTSPTATIGSVEMNGGSQLQIQAPDTGDFAGIAIYQDRRASDTNNSGAANSPNKINGGNTSFYRGALYFPSQQVTYNGNSSANVACMQLVTRRVYFSGAANITNTCPPGSASGSFSAPDGQVRLIA
ncbi:pilus assembly protein TadG-related protein [Sphingomicrobium marinum]|uniref:pilus assembly protein TadG-related protein n=1 Tax=Sphingomicrobium marinum TaxID=1227950 RepID=UPI00223EB5D3|nr:pilus assembly protein TadG-related protein [Sphingomicrobium marinum]